MHAERAQIGEQLVGARAYLVRQDKGAGETPVDPNRNRHRACVGSRGASISGTSDPIVDERAPPDYDRAAVDLADDAFTRSLHDGCRNAQWKRALFCFRHDSAGDHMLRYLIEGRTKAKNLIRGEPRLRPDLDHPGAPVCQRSGLVDHQRSHTRERLKGLSAFHEDAELRGPRNPRCDRNGNGEDQRAWRGNDQHRESADRISGPEPCGSRRSPR